MKQAVSTFSMKFPVRVFICSGLLLALPLLVSFFLGENRVVIGWSQLGAKFLMKEAEAREVRPGPVQPTPRVARPAPVPREARVHHPHVPRNHINTYVYSDIEYGDALTSLPGDCEEVSGEEATFYCEGMYYRAFYHGNKVVYVPESSLD
ncbi:hypothetical protein [Nitrospira sp. Ecomares 2.1]